MDKIMDTSKYTTDANGHTTRIDEKPPVFIPTKPSDPIWPFLNYPYED